MNIGVLLEMAAEGMGDQLLVGSADGGSTAAGVLARSRAVASLLRSRSVERLGYVGENDDLLVPLLFGAALADRTFAPVSYRVADPRLQAMLARLAPALLVVDDAVRQRVGAPDGVELRTRAELLAELAEVETTGAETTAAETTAADTAADAATPTERRPAAWLFTSGTTGEPKVAVLGHEHLSAYVLGTVEFLSARAGEAALVAVPPYHVAGVTALLTNVYRGRRTVFLPAFDPDAWVATARSERITHAMLVPTMLGRILRVLPEDTRTDVLPDLVHLSYGGGRMPRAVIEAALSRLPRVRFVNAYGLTETSATVTVLGPDEHRAALASADPAVSNRLASVGRPLPGVAVEIRDPRGRALPPGASGEVWVQGEQVSGEYLAGGSRLVDGWFPTRDRGHLDQAGYLYVEGRLDDVIVRGGENISPGEIEEVLLAHPGVAEAAVVGVPDDEWGERIVAAVARVPGAEVDARELQDWVRARLRSTYTPEHVDVRDALPYNETGKLLRRVLRDELAARYPTGGTGGAGVTVAPVTSDGGDTAAEVRGSARPTDTAAARADPEPERQTGPPEPEFRPVAGDFIRHLAERYGDRTLAVLGDRRLSYAEADRRSAVLAKGLLASGLGKGSRIGLLAPNRPDWIVAWLAGTRIGAVVVLLNTYAPPRELAWALRHADVGLLITVDRYLGRDYLERVAEAVHGIDQQRHESLWLQCHPYLRAIWTLPTHELAADTGLGARDAQQVRWAGPISELVARGEEVDDALLRAVEQQVTPADPMLQVYSSGSTADPKGAVHTHGAVVRHGLNLAGFRELNRDDRVYTTMPFFWVGGLSYVLVRAMHAGASIVCEERFDPGPTLELLERERVTQVLGWPHIGPALAGHPDFARRDLSALRVGPSELLAEDLGPADPGPVASALGMTETLGPHLIDDEGRQLPEPQRGSFGRPLPGLEHRVVDEAGMPVPPGESGELWVRGYSVVTGLHKQEREQVFTADGWYRTGDVGWFDEAAHFHFTSRLGDLIKSAGTNVSPREVELALEEQPEVTQAVVVGIPAGERGEDVAAAVVGAVSVDELVGRLRACLSAYKVPRHVLVLSDGDELPLLDSGKVDRRAVGTLLADRFTSRG